MDLSWIFQIKASDIFAPSRSMQCVHFDASFALANDPVKTD
ncbi:hypothetical protein EMOOHJMP_00138 [Microcystis phage MaAM05]|nr:hypothetical protein EMOOHJMP_00138 [Microcystis phage MaAM05]